MRSELPFQTAFCTEYEKLLQECQKAKEACAEWRAEMNSPLARNQINFEVAGELLRLQASYAKAYSRLERHNRECDLCQFVTQVSTHQREFSTARERSGETWPA
jgi:hypothetical protein